MTAQSWGCLAALMYEDQTGTFDIFDRGRH